jgi:D-alanine--poly(phosphoribitol) ligase subunit 1
MKILSGDRMPTLRRIVFGGEGYPLAKLKRLHEHFGQRSRIVNVYGPTECTCIASAYDVSAEDFQAEDGFPPLGRLIDNFDGLVLGADERPVTDGEAGELCLLGPHVGLGYYGDPERTAQSFVRNPLQANFAETMYRTGDLVRCDVEDGKLYILGRRDNQVKHLGYRIELEEIENALCRLPYVSQAVALHRRREHLSQLAAVVGSREDIDPATIRDDLGKYLPTYMIPSRFYFETELPTNANGKVDRKALKEAYDY